jgi:hypothetical protein
MDFEDIKFSKKLTPAFFQKKFPGFYSNECYEILADFYNKQIDECLINKKCKRKLEDTDFEEKEEEEDSGVEETKENVSSSELISSQC